MPFAILGLGTAIPPGQVSRAEGLVIAQKLSDPIVGRSDFLPDVYANSGVDTRYQVIGRLAVDDLFNDTRHSGSPFLPGPDPMGPTTAVRMKMYAECAPPLAVGAARIALDESGQSAHAITHLVTVSCTGFVAPGVDVTLIRELGLRNTVERVHVGYMGCHGAINGLRTAMAFAADPNAVVMVVAVELCSLHYYYGMAADKVVANALFADGAAAVVGRGSETGTGLRVVATGSCLITDSAELMGWRIDDHGFEMTLSKKIPSTIERHLRPWLEAWLNSHGVKIEAVGGWAVHPGGPRILSAVQKGLSLPEEAMSDSRQILAEYGNMSSPTVLFILDRLRKQNATGPIVILGFGPGMIVEAALVV